MSEFLHWTATRLAGAIRAKQLSASEAVQATIKHAQTVQAKLNCFVRIDEERAMARAKAIDADIARGNDPGPLAGVPMAHKDMYYRKGVASSCGSKITRDRPASATATALTRLDAAGAVQFGVLNMTEFAYGPLGHNYHLGHCRNPWHPEHVTGGSSSGSGSSLGARANFVALGSDTGGSIRLPAHFCGVTGLKPTYGRVSRAGAMPLSFSLDTVGPLARSAEDVATVMRAIAGRDQADSTSSTQPVPDYVAGLERPVKGLRIGVPTSYFYDNVDADVAALVRASLDVFRSLGCEVIEVDLPDMENWNHAATAIIAAEAAALHARWLRERPGDYSEQVRARLELGLAAPAPLYINGLRLRSQALQAWQDQVMAKVDVVHTPAVAFTTPTIAETDVGGGARMSDVLARVTRLMRPVNYLGLPGLVLPCGLQAHGLPCGMQLIGRPFDEPLLLRLGHAYQQATDWHTRLPGIAKT